MALVDLNYNRYQGGTAAQLSTLVDALADHCDVTVFCSTVEGTVPAGVEVVQVPSVPVFRFKLQYATFTVSWLLLGRLLRWRERFDIVHCNSALFGGWDVASVHFCSTEYLRVLKATPAGPVTTIQRLRRSYQLTMHGVTALLERWVFARPGRRARTLLPVSEGLAAALSRLFNPPLPLEVVPNPVDSERFHPGPDAAVRDALRRQAGWHSDPMFLLLFVAPGDWQRKGLDVAIAALGALPNQIKLAVAGGGDVGSFRHYAHALGLGDRVHFTGPSLDTAPLYRAADAFVFPSRYEALPMVCLEAMASGLPLVVPDDLHGISDFVRDGVNGRTVSRTPEAVAAAVLALSQDHAYRERLGAQARRTAARLNPQTVARQIVVHYERLLRGASATTPSR